MALMEEITDHSVVRPRGRRLLWLEQLSSIRYLGQASETGCRSVMEMHIWRSYGPGYPEGRLPFLNLSHRAPVPFGNVRLHQSNHKTQTQDTKLSLEGSLLVRQASTARRQDVEL